MVRRVPTTMFVIKRVIFVGRAVDSHSTGTEIDTVSKPYTWRKQMANFISSVAPPYETINVHFFYVWRVRVASTR